LLPQQVGQRLDGGRLPATQMTRADAELIGHFFSAQLLDITIEEWFVNLPGGRLGRLAGRRLEGCDGVDQDASERGRGVEAVGHPEEGGQRAVAKPFGIVQVIERFAQMLDQFFSRHAMSVWMSVLCPIAALKALAGIVGLCY